MRADCGATATYGVNLLSKFAFPLLVNLALVVGVEAQQYGASPERTAAALGHYARARALLVEALAEFEQGKKLARPDLLIDSEEWRLDVISRTEELNRVLDPQPRVTRSGIRFQASGLLARRSKNQVPPVLDGARESNTYAEEQREREKDAARLRYLQNSDLSTPSYDASAVDGQQGVSSGGFGTTVSGVTTDSNYSDVVQPDGKSKPAEKAGSQVNHDAIITLPDLRSKDGSAAIGSSGKSDQRAEPGVAEGDLEGDLELGKVQRSIEERVKRGLDEAPLTDTQTGDIGQSATN